MTILGSLPASASAGPVEDLINGVNDGLGGVLGGGSSADPGSGGGSASKAHAQGTVAAVDVNPGQEGFLAGEEAVVGRSRAEQSADGSYNGHITILGLLGREILGVDTNEGETAGSPFQPLQDILDQVCSGSQDTICLQLLVADSSSNGNGSSNDFGVARADLKLGEESISAGAAESSGSLEESGNCQTATASSELARADVLGILDAHVLRSFVQSVACSGAAGTQQNDSTLLSLNGNGLPLPGGCVNGNANGGFGILGLVTVSCNSDASSEAGGSRGTIGVDALDPALASATTPDASSSAAAPSGDGTTPGPGPDDDAAGGPGDDGSGATGDGGGGDDTAAGPAAGDAQAGGGELAFTGSNLIMLALIGLGLIASGLAFASRRRRPRIGVSL
jgi:hypothetical protein